MASSFQRSGYLHIDQLEKVIFMHDLSLLDFEYYVRVIDKQLITNDKSARTRKVPAGGAGDH
ncbi:hypothetical protein NC653_012112 [Populus alba x Populus x berolinensis]|uniref:Uncharacterized protein n=1 Tax=Populus alba x Populus x berolinensis TaxID=444605 RepID=A0AAD6R3U4_9ROSI|nr:hypothetical protein NC653_012112 [Populus alba x Populus x berolinensis]